MYTIEYEITGAARVAPWTSGTYPSRDAAERIADYARGSASGLVAKVRRVADYGEGGGE